MTVQVLKDIRKELRGQRGELSEVRGELRAELKAVREEVRSEFRSVREDLQNLERRQLGTEMRLATELTAVVGAIHELRDVLIDDRRLRGDVADHERRIVPDSRPDSR